MKEIKKMKKYDIIIVGAGMAGLSTAMQLSKKRNVKTLLIDKEKEITAYHMIGTFNDIVERYKLQEAVVNTFKSFRFYSPKEMANISFGKDHYMAYLDLKKLAKICKKRLTCDIRSNTEIVFAKYQDDGLVLTDKKGKNHFANVVIDCSGNTAVVADSLGIERSNVYCKTFSYTINKVKIPKKFQDVPMMFQDRSITRCAGAWITPYGKNKAHVGISSLNPYYQSSRGDLQRRIDLFLLSVPEYKNYVKNSKSVGIKFFKISPVLQAIDPMVKDNLIVVGDAAGQATPFFGLGSDPCFQMGEAAANIAIKAVEKKNHSQKFLMQYEKIWWKKFGKFDLINIILRDFCTNYFEDEDWDDVVRSLKKVSSKDFFKALRSEYDLGLMFRIFSPKVFTKLLYRVGKAKMLGFLHPKLSARHMVSRL